MKKYLITGCAGFIGSNFVHYMLNKYEDILLVNLDKLTLVTPTFSESSFKEILRSAITLSSLKIIFPILIMSHHLVLVALVHKQTPLPR